jgi:hypothetical protein
MRFGFRKRKRIAPGLFPEPLRAGRWYQHRSSRRSPTFRSAPALTRAVGDTIPLGGRTLRVIDVRPESAPDDDPVLVVETVWPRVNAGLGSRTLP